MLERFDGIPVLESAFAKPGQYIVIPDDSGVYGRPGGKVVFVHGLTMVWLRHNSESNEAIHRASMVWIERNIEMQAALAIDRIMNMHLHRDDFRLAHG